MAKRTAESVLRDLVKAQDDLLAAYRLGSDRRAGSAIDRLQRYRAELVRIDGAPVPTPTNVTE